MYNDWLKLTTANVSIACEANKKGGLLYLSPGHPFNAG